jgi:hypothetical protein
MAMRIRSVLVATSLLSVGTLVVAHHSFARYDGAKTLTLEGTVRDFQWTNPHIWVQLIVKDATNSTETEWSIEGASPNALSRRGWKRTSLRAGDQVKMVINPPKDGSIGGSLVSVMVDGQKVGD